MCDNETLTFIKKFVNGYRIVSTGDLSEFQISNARVENRLYVDEVSGLGWVALPWDLSTKEDKDRELHLLDR